MSTSALMPDPTADRAACESRTAFVLAGGAALGAMQAGMVHALYERGIAPDLLIGTSAGALPAAFLASRPATVATAQELAAVWRGAASQRHPPAAPGRPDGFSRMCVGFEVPRRFVAEGRADFRLAPHMAGAGLVNAAASGSRAPWAIP